MLLKQIDEVLQAGLFDCHDDSPFAEVTLVAPTLGEKIMEWRSVDQARVAKSALQYNDTSDGSNTLIGSFQKFYQSQAALTEALLYNGGSMMFKDRKPAFGGIAKAAVYLRYSEGVRRFLADFDPDQAAKLEAERDRFESELLDKTKKFPTKWQNFTTAPNQWYLAAITQLSDGRWLVPFLKRGAEPADYRKLEEIDIDVEHSLALMDFFTAPPQAAAGKEIISDLFQMGKGLGRNPFGRDLKSVNSASDFRRLAGVVPDSSRQEILEVLSCKLEYRLKCHPNPDGSKLIFLPENGLPYSGLKTFVEGENTRRDLYFKWRKAKASQKDDATCADIKPPAAVPAIGNCTIYLANEEGSQKKKLIIQRIFNSVELAYFARLNEELLTSNLQYFLVNYMKKTMTGQDTDTPSVFQCWTEVFTAALQKQPVSGEPVYRCFQRYAHMQSGDELIEKRGANRYFELIGRLLRLQHLIYVAENDPEKLYSDTFRAELNAIGSFVQTPKRGVFGIMNNSIPSGETLIGASYNLLRDGEKSRFEKFITLAQCGVPTGDFTTFARGALTGMLLQNLCWLVQREGRRFSATQGRQPTRLRGAELTFIFTKGIGLLQNLGKEHIFNCNMLPFVKSMEGESMRDAFNSGLIIGMTFIDKTPKTEDEEVEK